MSTQKNPEAHTATEQHPVRDAAGVRLAGWAVRPDVIVVQAGGLTQPLSARVGRTWVEAAVVHETEGGPDAELPWTALELPAGSLHVTGEPVPPVLPKGLHDDSRGARAGTGATTACDDLGVPIWCLFFPKMKGCPQSK